MAAKQDKWQADVEMLSPLNRSSEVIGELNIRPKITLCDATIREGEQGTAAGFTID